MRLHWEFSDEEIHWKDTDGNPADPYYAYDPRVIKLRIRTTSSGALNLAEPSLGLAS